MIIPDTSIWIEYFKQHEPYCRRFDLLLEGGHVVAVAPVFGELLQGVKNRREERIICDFWKVLPKIDEASLWIDAGLYSSQHQLVSSGVGLIDVYLIMACTHHRYKLWTLDQKLQKVAGDEILLSSS